MCLYLILGISDFQQNFIPENDYRMQPCSSMQGSRYNEPAVSQNRNSDNHRPSASVLPTELNSLQKVEDILAKQQAAMSCSQAYCETTSDETLDKLSSLDLGIDPSDLDVNLSGITLDPFSESSGLNFSTASMETKNS